MWLSDCVIKDPSQVELLLLTSKAAYDTASLDRDRLTQALLEIDLSFAYSEDLIDTLDDEQCKTMIAALGVGVQFPDDPSLPSENGLGTFDIAKLRYGKVIVVTEKGEVERRVGDEVLRFFFTYMRPLIGSGHVYVLETPLEPGFTQAEFVERVVSPITRRLKVIARRWSHAMPTLHNPVS